MLSICLGGKRKHGGRKKREIDAGEEERNKKSNEEMEAVTEGKEVRKEGRG